VRQPVGVAVRQPVWVAVRQPVWAQVAVRQPVWAAEHEAAEQETAGQETAVVRVNGEGARKSMSRHQVHGGCDGDGALSSVPTLALVANCRPPRYSCFEHQSKRHRVEVTISTPARCPRRQLRTAWDTESREWEPVSSSRPGLEPTPTATSKFLPVDPLHRLPLP